MMYATCITREIVLEMGPRIGVPSAKPEWKKIDIKSFKKGR